MYIFTGGSGEHGRIEVSAYAQRTLAKIEASDPKLHGRILAAIQYYFEAWVPGDAEPDGVDHFSKLSRVCNHDIYRIKDEALLGEWRVLVLFVPTPPRNPVVAELMLYTDHGSYNDLAAEHNRNVKKLVQDLILAGRMRRR